MFIYLNISIYNVYVAHVSSRYMCEIFTYTHDTTIYSDNWTMFSNEPCLYLT